MSEKARKKFEDHKKHYVRMALETNNYAKTAKAACVHQNTLRDWIKKYETEVRYEMKAKGDRLSSSEPTEQEYKKKYEMAMKLLGEKELEVAVLKDALKRNEHP